MIITEQPVLSKEPIENKSKTTNHRQEKSQDNRLAFFSLRKEQALSRMLLHRNLPQHRKTR